MALPKIDSPVFKVVVPVLDKELTLRPYLMKEEKILLLAQQSEDLKQIITAMKQIISNCIVEGDLDVNTVPSFVIEWLMLQLRKQSVGNISKVSYRDTEDNEVYEFEINLDDVIVKVDPSHTDSVELTENLGLLMKYPSLDIVTKVDIKKSEVNFSYDVIKLCIDKVFTDDEILEFDTYSDKEQEEFLDQFSREQMESLINFFSTVPTLYYEIVYQNKNGNERRIELNSLSDFFI